MSFPLLTPAAPPEVPDFEPLDRFDHDDRSEHDTADRLEEQFFVEWEVPEAL